MSTNNVIINRNIENASHSTGPRTDEGKSIASQNSLKHGLASGTLLIPGEDPAAYEALVADFICQHEPQTPGEEIAITDMAHAWWLKTRAIALQNRYLEDEKMLPLYLRYQAAHERAYYRALAELRKLKQERPESPTGSVSQEERDDATFDDLRDRYGDEVIRKVLDDDIKLAQVDECPAEPDSESTPIDDEDEDNDQPNAENESENENA
jgi:hypothetical protein